jgi:hypothetical protein
MFNEDICSIIYSNLNIKDATYFDIARCDKSKDIIYDVKITPVKYHPTLINSKYFNYMIIKNDNEFIIDFNKKSNPYGLILDYGSKMSNNLDKKISDIKLLSINTYVELDISSYKELKLLLLGYDASVDLNINNLEKIEFVSIREHKLCDYNIFNNVSILLINGTKVSNLPYFPNLIIMSCVGSRVRRVNHLKSLKILIASYSKVNDVSELSDLIIFSCSRKLNHNINIIPDTCYTYCRDNYDNFSASLFQLSEKEKNKIYISITSHLTLNKPILLQYLQYYLKF